MSGAGDQSIKRTSFIVVGRLSKHDSTERGLNAQRTISSGFRVNSTLAIAELVGIHHNHEIEPGPEPQTLESSP